MGALSSKPSTGGASSSITEPSASVPAKEPRDGAGRSAGALACIPPSEATGSLKRRLCFARPEDDGNAKRIRDVDNVVGDAAHLGDDGELYQEQESQLFSCPPSGGAGSFLALCPSGSASRVQQPSRPFELDATKHKVFLSHSGAQKDFVEQLCVDLERVGYSFPFFDQRDHSLRVGEDFAPLILEAARLCHVAVVVLSKEFLCSKWPMIELAAFYAARQDASDGVVKPKLLPLFFRLSVEEVKDEGRWMPMWRKHAARDGRIDLTQWSAAVKALCGAHGLEFGQFARKEVPYRKCIVESVFKLSPPDVRFGISESMVGYDRMCEAMSRQFVEDTSVGAQVLGVYGDVGIGKTMLAKAMCDYYCGEFLGKVCYVDMGLELDARRYGESISQYRFVDIGLEWRTRRQERTLKMLKMLRGFEKDVVGFVDHDVEKALTQMKTHMKRERVFLVFDNIIYKAHLLEEVQEYLKVGFHPMSKVMIISSSRAILKELIPNTSLYVPMPVLMAYEARELFLKHMAPAKALSELTSAEQSILGFCIEKCRFYSEQKYYYHPVALKALANFFFRMREAEGISTAGWKAFLEENVDQVEDALDSSKDLFRILCLQFSTFSFPEKLLFLDLALFTEEWISSSEHWLQCDIDWVCRVQCESPSIIKMRLLDLGKAGMIKIDLSSKKCGWRGLLIAMPTLYGQFAKWYTTDRSLQGSKNVYGVFGMEGSSLRGESSTPVKCWSNLIQAAS